MPEPVPPSNQPAEGEEQRRDSVTDSPWFWLLLFSLMALVALQAMGRKYGQRQAQIEQQYQGRQWSQLQPATAEREKHEVIAFSSDKDVLIGLRPLRLFAMVLIALSGAMLWHRWRNRWLRSR